MEKFMATKQTVSQVGKMHLPSGIKMGACIEDRYKLVAKYFLIIFFNDLRGTNYRVEIGINS